MYVEKSFSTCHVSVVIREFTPYKTSVNVENPSTIGHSSPYTKEGTWGHLHDCCSCAENTRDKHPCLPENSKLRNPMTVNMVGNTSTISLLLLCMKEVTWWVTVHTWCVWCKRRTLWEVSSLYIEELALLRNPKGVVYTEMPSSVGRPLLTSTRSTWIMCMRNLLYGCEKHTFIRASVITVSERATQALRIHLN